MSLKLSICLRTLLVLLVPFLSTVGWAQTPQYYKGPGTTSSQFPFKNNGGAKCQLWYAPGDFSTLPITGYITTIYFRSQYAGQSGTYTNFRVLMKQPASGTGFSTSTAFETGLTLAHYNPLESITGAAAVGGWYAINLSIPFLYDNTLPLVVETQYDAPFGGVGLDNFGTSTTLFRKIYASSLTATTGTASNGFWQDFGMDIIPPGPCTSPPVAGTSQANPVVACPGANVTLTLQGHTQGTGQMYQWQSAPSITGPWSPEGSSSSLTSLVVTPSPGTTYFRCMVTCGTTSDFSVPVAVNVLNVMSGTYTINATQPASATNFQSVTDAVSAATCAGVSGPVIFDIATGSGPYNGQVVIGAIPGSSAANTITINGNGETINYASTASATRPTILLNGANYVTLNNINIQASGATYGWGIHLTNNADNDSVKNCTISITSTSTTAANTAGIVASGSGTSITTAGNADNIVLMNNTITGGYQGMILTGSSATNLSNNKIIGNTIKDFYSDGIIMTYNLSPEVVNNDISRSTRTAVTTFTGIELGAGNSQAKVNGNRIHDTHNAATTQSGAAYGIHITGCDATSGNENLIFNNLIYNFNSGTGVQNGLRNTGSDGSYFYHNTVVLDYGASTSGDAHAFYQTTSATNIQLRNNIFYNTRTGTGTKYGVYLATTASVVASDNNVLYINAPAGNNYIGRSAGTDQGWSGWQGAGFDISGSNQDPVFQDPFGGNFATTNASVNNIGTPIAAVTTDINALPRSTVAPDPGAFENLNFPLGLTLSNFTAQRKETDVYLAWQTLSEKNMRIYEIERSVDGNEYEAVGRVKAQGDAASHRYDFTDANIVKSGQSEVYYYRLKMVENSGDFQYSKTVKITTAATNESVVLSVHPNPVTDAVAVTLTNRILGADAVLQVIDATGKIVETIRVIQDKQFISMKRLPSGVYTIVYKDNSYMQSVKIQKQ
ncbi:MAG TPA: right-handed parallel beta-helix repeat-containing protein [Flavipsychrobacter sp.]|nr:right-handed parallel beta-helix repeat-containing protein [Flavipsychrobacter sp.]